MCSSKKNEKTLFNHLYKKYLEIGKNFNFKSKDIAKHLPIHPRAIGKSAMQLVRHNLLIKANPGNDNTFLTKFTIQQGMIVV